MKEQYIVLTGSKNNAGDYLIKYRAKKLFKEFRPDREIIDYNAWEKFDQTRLNEVNNSKALILLGGPALQSPMRPKIYPMVDNLDDIKVPIIMMGIGWKSVNGSWNDTYEYPLTDDSIKLLKKIDQSGYQSSVRDYHTLNAIRFKGCNNFMMTGCPAYYDLPSIDNDIKISAKLNKVVFSLGVSFIESSSMQKQMKEVIIALKDLYKEQIFEVVFHHSLQKEKFLQTHNATSKHVNAHNDFASWLDKQNIAYVDISGSAENLMNYYSEVDLHIGYRVHAHIFMNSISKFSVLISEDGRGKATKDVIGGIVLDGFSKVKMNLLSKVLGKLTPKYDRFEANNHIKKELIDNINYEKKIDYSRIKASRKSIDNNLNIMKNFIQQLP